LATRATMKPGSPRPNASKQSRISFTLSAIPCLHCLARLLRRAGENGREAAFHIAVTFS
jgi:hypothetical protein